MTTPLHLVDSFALEHRLPPYRNGSKSFPTIPGLRITDLSEFVGIDGPRPSIEVDGVGLLYPGLVHDVHGEAGSGKTWFAFRIATQVLGAGGNVVLLDYESSPPMVTERMTDLGVRDGLLFDPWRFARVEPPDVLDHRAVERLSDLRDLLQPTLVVVDSLSALLALADADENDNMKARRAYEHLRLAFQGVTVLVIDHTSTKDVEAAQRGARGASSKRDAVDVSLHLQVVERFSRDRDGRARVVIRKDRPGRLCASGEPIADLVVRHGDDPWMRITAPASGTEPVAGVSLDLLILDFIAEHGPSSKNAVRQGIHKRPETVTAAINALVEVGELVDIGGKFDLPGAAV